MCVDACALVRACVNRLYFGSRMFGVHKCEVKSE